MIAIAILAIMLTIAAPSFRSLIERSNIETLQNNFATAVVVARTEAASRAVEARVCALPLPAENDSADVVGCANTWEQGWGVVFIDADRRYRVVAEFPNGPDYPLSVRAVAADDALSATNQIRFNSQGYNITQERFLMSVCEGPKKRFTRGVVVEVSGRSIHLQTDAEDGDFKARFHNGDTDAASTNIQLNCGA